MALRKHRTRSARACRPRAAVSNEPKVGASVEECVALGQALVEAGHLQGEVLAASLVDGNGDLWEFGQILLTKYGVGRVGVRGGAGPCLWHAGGRHPVHRARCRDLGRGRRADRPQVSVRPGPRDGGKVTVWGADSVATHRADAEAAAGKKFEWFATDPKTVTSFMEQMWRSDADIGRLVATFQESRRRRPGRRGRRQRGQPRRPGARGPARVAHRRPGAPRPCVRHPHRTARQRRPRAVPHRRSAGRGRAAAVHGAQPAGVAPQDHVVDEHRREACAAGRPVLDHGRRPPARRARCPPWPRCSARRSSCVCSTRASRWSA